VSITPFLVWIVALAGHIAARAIWPESVLVANIAGLILGASWAWFATTSHYRSKARREENQRAIERLNGYRA